MTNVGVQGKYLYVSVARWKGLGMASNGTINKDNPTLKNAPSYAAAIDSGRMDDTR